MSGGICSPLKHVAAEGTAFKLWAQKLHPREEVLTSALLMSVRFCQVASCMTGLELWLSSGWRKCCLEEQGHYLNDALALYAGQH